jgi:uncharacterized protein YndB with AHSA1/START domain
MTEPAIMQTAEHRTLVLGRTFEVPIQRVYSALTDPLERARLGASGDNFALILDASDVRIGGRDCFRFGLRGEPRLRGETVYHWIAVPSLIVATETIYAEATCVSVAMVTHELREHRDATDLKMTVQLLALTDDEDLADEAGARHTALIDNLARHLGTPGRDQQRTFSRRRR